MLLPVGAFFLAFLFYLTQRLHGGNTNSNVLLVVLPCLLIICFSPGFLFTLPVTDDQKEVWFSGRSNAVAPLVHALLVGGFMLVLVLLIEWIPQWCNNSESEEL